MVALMEDERAAAPHVRRRLLELRCWCCAPATRIHIVDPSTAHRPPKHVGFGSLRNAYPGGTTSVARPACDLHTFDSYSFDLAFPLRDWDGWLDHISAKGIGADTALRRLVEPPLRPPETREPPRRASRRIRLSTAPWWS